MIKSRFLYQALSFALLICSCSVDLSQTSVTPRVEQTPMISTTSTFPATQVPVTWTHLNLTGKLVYLSSMTEGDQLTSNVQLLDLEAGTISTLLSIPSAWVYYATVSAERNLLVMSYSPPQQSSSSSNRSLYVIPLDTSAEPQPLFTPPTPSDRYTQAEWSPDGSSIYYVHYNQEQRPEGQFYEDYDISQLTYPEGEHRKILEHAFWPRVSPDSSKLVYVSLDPESGRNELFIANTDGSNSRRVTLSGSQPLEIIDAPIFSPDGQSILFSAPPPSQSHQPNFLERLAGIQIAKAHSVPSDWWSVPIAGGVPTRLTNLQTINLFASISPDQQHIASLSGDGIFVMDLDGSNLTQIVSDPGVHGTISWIP
jgi:Tol biopolymer transport system component